ncbi:MAG: glycosyltransferase family 4 protein, partial [Lentisphaerae bacterium]|nr:glycosyltransferase family 4 protein [Lentisphaerota bacterium]
MPHDPAAQKPVTTKHAMPDHTMRILFLDCAPFHGGAQESLRTLIQDLHDQGVAMQLVAADHAPGGLLDDAQQRSLHAYAIRARHWPANAIGLWQFLRDRRTCGKTIVSAISEFAPTIIHANGLRAAMLLSPRVTRDTAVVIHDRDLRAPTGLAGLLARRLSPQVVAISGAVAQKWSMLPLGRLSVIPNGFDLAAIAATTPAATPFPADAVVVTIAADFIAWKNHRLLLDAIALLRPTRPALRVIIRGRARDRHGETLLAELRRHCSHLGLDDIVAFVTAPGPALPWIAATDVLAAMATAEPFGRTLIEALALGKPVVACTGAGHSEVLADCPAATLCAPDPAAIATALA